MHVVKFTGADPLFQWNRRIARFADRSGCRVRRQRQHQQCSQARLKTPHASPPDGRTDVVQLIAPELPFRAPSGSDKNLCEQAIAAPSGSRLLEPAAMYALGPISAKLKMRQP